MSFFGVSLHTSEYNTGKIHSNGTIWIIGMGTGILCSKAGSRHSGMFERAYKCVFINLFWIYVIIHETNVLLTITLTYLNTLNVKEIGYKFWSDFWWPIVPK